MGSSLALSSFISLCPKIYAPDEWNKRIRSNLETLTSLSTIEAKQKIYLYAKEEKIYRSSWMIAENLKGWIGEWAANYLAGWEEALYRRVWRLSIDDTIDGILGIKRTLVKTLAIAARTLDNEGEKEAIVDLSVLKRQIESIRSILELAKMGLLKLNETYEALEKQKKEEKEKKLINSLKPVVEDFYKEISEFADSLIAQIAEATKEKQAVKENEGINAERKDEPLPAPPMFQPIEPAAAPLRNVVQDVQNVPREPEATASPILPSPAAAEQTVPALPLANPTVSTAETLPVIEREEKSPPRERQAMPEVPVEQLQTSLQILFQTPESRSCEIPAAPFCQPKYKYQANFNRAYRHQFESMQLELMQKKTDEKSTTLPAATQKGRVTVRKGRSKERPWTRWDTHERSYFLCHIPMVPKGRGGRWKKDKLGYNLTDKCHMAKLSTKIYNKSQLEIAKNEEKFLNLCNGLTNVVRTFDIFWVQTKDGVWKQVILQEFCGRGELAHSLLRLKSDPVAMESVMMGMLRGVAALHAKNIVHRDLKPANFFLTEKDEVKLGDFGFACMEDEYVAELKGSGMYIDPDVVNHWHYSKGYSDIWTLGMIFYAMLNDPTLERPWPWLQSAKSFEDVLKLNNEKKDAAFPEPPIENKWLHACWEMLQLDPKKRPTAQQLLDRFAPADSNIN